jgi:tRNA 2-thiocytidine biosynthesis protein TtcA
MGNVVGTHLLDRGLQDFAAIRATGVPQASGDIAFDDDPCTMPSPVSALRIETI